MSDSCRVMLCVFACCAVAFGADAPAESRVWKVSDAAGLLAAAKEIGGDGGLISIEPGEQELSLMQVQIHLNERSDDGHRQDKKSPESKNVVESPSGQTAANEILQSDWRAGRNAKEIGS